MKICGPKLSICCMVLSVWGIVMLALMGIFLRVKSPAFAEDLPIDDDKLIQEGMPYVEGLYNQASTNCFIAAAFYILVFGISFVQHRINLRANYVMS